MNEDVIDTRVSPRLNVFQRINKVREGVAYIRKDKKVESYMAVTHDAVTAETRPLFVEHGIVIVPKELSSVSVDTGTTTSKGTPFIRVEAKYRIEFVNIDDPHDIAAVELTAHALDHGDKAPGKAHSYAVKYAILKILSLESGEGDEDREEQKPAKKESAKSIAKATEEDLTIVQRSKVKQIASAALDLFAADDAHGAYEVCETSGFDIDEKVALWSYFDSKQRTALKEIHKLATAKE